MRQNKDDNEQIFCDMCKKQITKLSNARYFTAFSNLSPECVDILRDQGLYDKFNYSIDSCGKCSDLVLLQVAKFKSNLFEEVKSGWDRVKDNEAH